MKESSKEFMKEYSKSKGFSKESQELLFNHFHKEPMEIYLENFLEKILNSWKKDLEKFVKETLVDLKQNSLNHF